MQKTGGPDARTQMAREEALHVLRHCADPLGMKASAYHGKGRSGKDKRGYPHVWGRDSMITALGALLTGDRAVIASVRQSIRTLRKHQTPLGMIPNNVHTITGRVNLRAYADGTAWFVIGVAAVHEATGSVPFVRENWTAVKKALQWYAYQGMEGSHLVWMQEATDWEDLFAVRGRGLYVNVLVALAHQKAAGLAKALGKRDEARRFSGIAGRMRARINERFWWDGSRDSKRGIYGIVNNFFDEPGFEARYFREHRDAIICPKKKVMRKDGYYLPYLTYWDFGEWFDSFGNLLAIVTGVADAKKAGMILKTMDRHGIASPHPVKAIHPPVMPEDKDWRYYYRRGRLNLPNQYHNGGIWPFLGGLYVAALVKTGERTRATKALRSLAEANRTGRYGEWEFNEWLHGETGKPKGMAEQAWSAGMYVFAHDAVTGGKVRFIA